MFKRYNKAAGFLTHTLFAMLLTIVCTLGHAENNKVTISLQEVELYEVMKMLSQQKKVNIVLGEGVEGKVSINLYDMELHDAINAISWAAGFAVEKRGINYFIVDRDEVGKYGQSDVTEIRSFKVQYSQPSEVESILKKHLSSYGKITTLSDRQMLIVEDLPEVLDNITLLLQTIDTEPRQILIEAKVLEVTLKDSDSFGVDWTKIFDSSDGTGSFGARGLSNTAGSGFFFQFVGPNIEIALDALKQRGRLRTLSTPTLLAMEDRTAETVVGTELGYRVTTTINQVTSESVEFLETGIILKVTPSVDQQGMILLDIHPEVSDGSVSPDGIPSKTTTQLSTRMLVPDGQSVFLGGLIKRGVNETRDGIPLLSDIPLLGNAFSRTSRGMVATEIVVLIKPKLMDFRDNQWVKDNLVRTDRFEQRLKDEERIAELKMDNVLNDYSLREQSATGREGDDELWILD